MTLYQPVKESVQLVTTPSNRPKSVLMNNQNTKFEEFMLNVHNMSSFRLIIFVLSISLCFVTIIAVLFVVPCEWSNCISTKNDESFWSDSIFKDMELNGRPSIIELNQKLLQLVFIVRGSILNSQNVPPRTERLPSDGGGLLQIDTKLVTEMWHKRIHPLPDKIDCKLLNNEFKENSDVYCIVGSSNGNLLGVISSKHKGEFIWKYTKGGPESNTTKLYNKNDIIYTEFPVIIPDCNSDGVNEMAFIQHKNNISTIVIVSGKNGKDMINNIVNNNCTKMTDLILKYDMSLVYYCRTNSSTDPIETVPIKTMLNCSGDWIPDSIHQNERKHDPSEENQFPLGHYCLNIISNHYNCLSKCKVFINVTNNFGETVWSTNIDRAYVMKPVTFELRNNISGFIIKIWHWDNVTNENNIKFANVERIEHIREEIMVIMYNSSRIEDFHVENISSNSILQVCVNESSCQPKLEYQKYSLNVIDINNDGYRELVSVLVTFEPLNPLNKFSINDKHSLQLVSKINVCKLESQLIEYFQNDTFV